MNKCQKNVFNRIKDLIENRNNDGKIIFLDAPGGTGKTFTLNVIISWIRMNNLEVAATATSGIAATLLHLGRTAHNRFKIPVDDLNPRSTCNVARQSETAKFLSNISLAIIDEGPMLHRLCYKAIDRTMKDMVEKKDQQKKFGGKIVLISGDWRQVLPVVPRGNRSKIVTSTIKSSSLWENVEVLSLTENMRVKNEKKKHQNNVRFHQQLDKHEKWLLNLGENKLPRVESVKNESIIEVPEHMCRDNKEDVVKAVFGDFKDYIGNKNYFKSRILLAATNEVVDEINDEMVKEMPGPLYTLISVDTVGDTDNPTMFPPEYLNKLNPSGLPQHKLRLKKNTVVILLRNMDLPGGHCNGTRYLVTHIGTYRLLLEKLNPKQGDTNTTLILPRIPMVHKSKHLPCTVSRLQFPIKIAYCLTINRAQG